MTNNVTNFLANNSCHSENKSYPRKEVEEVANITNVKNSIKYIYESCVMMRI